MKTKIMTMLAVLMFTVCAFIVVNETQDSDADVTTDYWGGVKWTYDSSTNTITFTENDGTESEKAAQELALGTKGVIEKSGELVFSLNGITTSDCDVIFDDTIVGCTVSLQKPSLSTGYTSSLHIGKNATNLSGLEDWRNTFNPGTITVDSNNHKFLVYDGDLYTSDYRLILFHLDSSTVKTLHPLVDGDWMDILFNIVRYWSIEEYSVSEEATNVKVIDGVLFSKDGKTLLSYPSKKEGDSYQIPVPVELVRWTSFKGTQILESIEFPSTLTSVEKAFESTGINHLDFSKVTNKYTLSGQSLYNRAWEYIDLGNNCKSIGNLGLYQVGLSFIVLPESLESVGQNCFADEGSSRNLGACYNISNKVVLKLSDGKSPFYSKNSKSTDLFDITERLDQSISSKIVNTGDLGSRLFKPCAGIRIHLDGGDTVWAFTSSSTKEINQNTLDRAIKGYTISGYYWDAEHKSPISNLTAEKFYATTDGTSSGTSTYGKIYDIYASSEPVRYTVKYNVNAPEGTSPSGQMENKTITYGVTTPLDKNRYSISGYSFVGWATSPTGNVRFNDGGNVLNLTDENGATINLYARWNSGPFIVYLSSSNSTYGTVKIQGSTANYIADVPAFTGIQVMGDMVTVGDTIVVATPTKSNPQWDYSFAGWTLNGADLSDSATVSGDMQLQGVFVRTQHVEPEPEPGKDTPGGSSDISPTGEEDLDLFTAYRAQNKAAETKSSESDFEVDEVAIAAGAVCAVAACLGMALIPKP